MCLLPVYYNHGVIKSSVQKTLFYLFNQVITLFPKPLDASAEIKVFMKSDLQLLQVVKNNNLISATCVSPKGKMS